MVFIIVNMGGVMLREYVVWLIIVLVAFGCTKKEEPNTWGKIISIYSANDNGSVSPRFQYEQERIIYRDSLVIRNLAWMDMDEEFGEGIYFNPEYDDSETEINRGEWVIPIPKEFSDKFFELAEKQNPNRFREYYRVLMKELESEEPMEGDSDSSQRAYTFLIEYENLDQPIPWSSRYPDSERLEKAFEYFWENFTLPDSVGIDY